jgi:hypothetical protein
LAKHAQAKEVDTGDNREPSTTTAHGRSKQRKVDLGDGEAPVVVDVEVLGRRVGSRIVGICEGEAL